MDGAHNPASAAVLVDVLAGLPRKRTVFVVGIAADKDIPSMLRLLAPWGDEFVFTRTGNPRAAQPSDLKSLLEGIRPGTACHVTGTPAEAIGLARSLASPADRICITGSMYLAGDALAILAPRAGGP